MTDTATSKTKVTYGDQSIHIEREFDAPIERVFAAYTTAEDMANWWGPARYENEIEKFEPRTGGEWRITQRDREDGSSHPFRGVFHTVDANALIIQTFEYLGAPGHVNLEKMQFEDLGDGRTRLTATSVCEAPEALQAMKASGMESGMLETYERLAELVEA